MVLTGDNLYVCRTQFREAESVTIDDSKECINVRYADIEELCEHLQHLLITRPAPATLPRPAMLEDEA